MKRRKMYWVGYLLLLLSLAFGLAACGPLPEETAFDRGWEWCSRHRGLMVMLIFPAPVVFAVATIILVIKPNLLSLLPPHGDRKRSILWTAGYLTCPIGVAVMVLLAPPGPPKGFPSLFLGVELFWIGLWWFIMASVVLPILEEQQAELEA